MIAPAPRPQAPATVNDAWLAYDRAMIDLVGMYAHDGAASREVRCDQALHVADLWRAFLAADSQREKVG